MCRLLIQPLNLVATSLTRAIEVSLAVLVFGSGLAGCALFSTSDSDQSRQRMHDLEAENAVLREEIGAGRKDGARLQLQLLEQNARILELETQLEKRSLEEAEIRARLQRIDTRTQALTGPAQAAAAIAEAEAGLLVAETQGQVDPDTESAREIRRLLEAATIAYEAGQYARATDLGDQVLRWLANGVAVEASDSSQAMDGPESPFERPLVFRVLADSHLRRGPAMKFPAAAILPTGTHVTGLASQGRWVRVEAVGAGQGWIYGKLLDAPD